MIHSMTAFGSARAASSAGWVNVELRALNNRYLDLSLRLADELRPLEGLLRERLTRSLKRGKVEVRVNVQRTQTAAHAALDENWLAHLATQRRIAQRHLADVRAPSLLELLHANKASQGDEQTAQDWQPLCLQALDAALVDFQTQRQREGAQLAQAMQGYADQISALIARLQTALPHMQAAWQERLTNKLRSALEAASPQGFAHISGQELSARISQETLLFSLRTDVAEELTRLNAHVLELQRLLGVVDPNTDSNAGQTGSPGKRLDFLFQEMNREANTLASKASALEQTQTAIDLKLLIEQLREQAQNIE